MRRIIEGVRAKHRGNTILCKFLQGIWFQTQRKDGANTSVYSFCKETSTAKMFSRYRKYKIRSLEGDIDFFDIWHPLH